MKTLRRHSKISGIAHSAMVAASLFATLPAFAADAKTCADSFDKGQALRRENKLRAARETLLECSTQACPSMMMKDCSDLLVEIEQSMPSIVVTAKDASGMDAIAVKVIADGVVLATSLDGKALVLDPGVHAMRFEMTGATPIERQVVVHEGQKAQPVEITLDANPPKPRPGDPTQTPTQGGEQVPPPESRSSSMKWAGLGLMGVGVVSVGLGSVFGLVAGGKWSDAKDQCGPGCGPGSSAYDSRSAARTDATISTVSFVAGGLLVAGGATLWLLAPKENAKVAVSIAPNGVLLHGTF